MIRGLVRAFIRGVLVLVVVVSALGAYHLYRSGRLPFIEHALEDATTVGSVKAAFAIHRDLSRRPIDIDAEDGRVVLSGRVARAEERRAAEELASSIDGVQEVDNRIEVDPELDDTGGGKAKSLGEKIDDVALLAKVRTALALDRKVRKLDVEVAVSSGTVRLRGEIPSEELRERIHGRVASVGGVEHVADELVVTPPGELE